MSAGRGITHSEFNPSRTDLVHFLQIWIIPERPGISPSYEQEAIDLSAARGQFNPIASRQGGPGKVKLHQDAAMSVAILEPGEKLVHRLAGGRYGRRIAGLYRDPTTDGHPVGTGGGAKSPRARIPGRKMVE